MREKPVYIMQCVVCRKKYKTTNQTLRHCGRLTQWVRGIEGKGIGEEEKRKSEERITYPKMVKVYVSGYMEMSEENLKNILAYDDPRRGLCYSVHMSYCLTDNLEFSYDE